jgi:hypothetical protein
MVNFKENNPFEFHSKEQGSYWSLISVSASWNLELPWPCLAAGCARDPAVAVALKWPERDLIQCLMKG